MGNDAQHVVVGGLCEGPTHVADDGPHVQAALERDGDVAHVRGAEVDLPRVEGLAQLGPRVADDHLAVDTVLGEDALVHGDEDDQASRVVDGTDVELRPGGCAHDGRPQGDHEGEQQDAGHRLHRCSSRMGGCAGILDDPFAAFQGPSFRGTLSGGNGAEGGAR